MKGRALQKDMIVYYLLFLHSFCNRETIHNRKILKRVYIYKKTPTQSHLKKFWRTSTASAVGNSSTGMASISPGELGPVVEKVPKV